MKVTDYRRAAVNPGGTITSSSSVGGVSYSSNAPAGAGMVPVAISSNQFAWRDALSFGSNTNDVSSVGTMGSSPSNTRADHVHRGVHAILAAGSNSLYGDVNLVAGTGMAITAAGNSLTLASSAAAGAAGSSNAYSALTITETDGQPTDSAVTKLIFPAGTLSLSGHEVTVRQVPTGFIGASVYASANQTAGSVLFDTEVFDTDGFHSTSANTDRMTIPAGLSGKYLLTASAYVAATHDLRFYKNGAELTAASQSTSGGAANISAIADAVADDYFTVNNAPSQTVYGASGDFASSFSIMRLDSGTTSSAEMLLDYTYAGSDYSGASMTGAADFDVCSNQSFTVVSGTSLVEIAVRSLAQSHKSSAGDTLILVKALIDSAGSPTTVKLGGNVHNDSTYFNPFTGLSSAYVTLSAGAHTIKIQLRPDSTSDFYLRPSSTSEFLSVQVIEHAS